jgi:hypothetical protein
MTGLDTTVSEQSAVADCCEQHGDVTSVCVQERNFLGARTDTGLSRNSLPRVTSLSLTASSRVLLEKLTGSSRNSPTSYRTQKFTTAFTNARQPVPIPSQLEPVHAPTSRFLKIHLNIIIHYILYKSTLERVHNTR